MNLLVIVMAALTLLAALWLSRPWWRRQAAQELGRKRANVQAYRQRLDEIASELAAGIIDAATAETLKSEAGSRLLDDVADAGDASPAVSTSRVRAAALLGSILAIFAAGYYYAQGSWQAHQLVIGEREAPAAGGDVESMLARLAERMKQDPNNAEGWAMLGQSYFVMQRYAEAAQAYAKLNALTENRDPDALSGEGEALAMAADRELSGRPRALFEQALTVQPDHPKSLWYAGMAAYQAGDQAAAKAHWSLLRLQVLPDELRSILDQRLAEMGEPPAAALAAAPAASVEAAKPSEARLVISLELDPALKAQVPDNATLIVFARAEAGPPMPLAVYRAPLGELPAEITLDDSMAMMPNMKLSAFDRWTVTARISRSGQAQAESGDLQGSGGIAREQAGDGLKLVIDQVVP